jgi:hypothetical protein
MKFVSGADLRTYLKARLSQSISGGASLLGMGAAIVDG